MKPSKKANGLMYAGNGKLLACQMEGRLVRIDLKTKEVEVLADKYQDKPFNACNDLVIDKQGGIYFTDPRFGATNPWPQGTEAFYYRAADGTVSRWATIWLHLTVSSCHLTKARCTLCPACNDKWSLTQ